MQNRITFSNVIGVLLENKKKTYAQYRMIEDIFFDCLSNMDLFEKDDFEKNVEDIVTMVVTAVDSMETHFKTEAGKAKLKELQIR